MTLLTLVLSVLLVCVVSADNVSQTSKPTKQRLSDIIIIPPEELKAEFRSKAVTGASDQLKSELENEFSVALNRKEISSQRWNVKAAVIPYEEETSFDVRFTSEKDYAQCNDTRVNWGIPPHRHRRGYTSTGNCTIIAYTKKLFNERKLENTKFRGWFDEATAKAAQLYANRYAKAHGKTEVLNIRNVTYVPNKYGVGYTRYTFTLILLVGYEDVVQCSNITFGYPVVPSYAEAITIHDNGTCTSLIKGEKPKKRGGGFDDAPDNAAKLYANRYAQKHGPTEVVAIRNVTDAPNKFPVGYTKQMFSVILLVGYQKDVIQCSNITFGYPVVPSYAEAITIHDNGTCTTIIHGQARFLFDEAPAKAAQLYANRYAKAHGNTEVLNIRNVTFVPNNLFGYTRYTFTLILLEGYKDVVQCSNITFGYPLDLFYDKAISIEHNGTCTSLIKGEKPTKFGLWFDDAPDNAAKLYANRYAKKHGPTEVVAIRNVTDVPNKEFLVGYTKQNFSVILLVGYQKNVIQCSNITFGYPVVLSYAEAITIHDNGTCTTIIHGQARFLFDEAPAKAAQLYANRYAKAHGNTEVLNIRNVTHIKSLLGYTRYTFTLILLVGHEDVIQCSNITFGYPVVPSYAEFISIKHNGTCTSLIKGEKPKKRGGGFDDAPDNAAKLYANRYAQKHGPTEVVAIRNVTDAPNKFPLGYTKQMFSVILLVGYQKDVIQCSNITFGYPVVPSYAEAITIHDNGTCTSIIHGKKERKQVRDLISLDLKAARALAYQFNNQFPYHSFEYAAHTNGKFIKGFTTQLTVTLWGIYMPSALVGRTVCTDVEYNIGWNFTVSIVNSGHCRGDFNIHHYSRIVQA
ncbi:hypothetical protein M8J76_013362 [Diaphorina citri]|nr:hypothetical protein M8J75_002087 [Diaphorina citri]KAI5716848.1 hypothetical protein M8J76_013362 [Diaphorina citri]